MAATSCRDCHVGLCPPRNDTERVDNKILCHCEAEQGSAVAISPLKKEQKKAKIYALILSIIFLFTALVGGSVFLIVNHINKSNAFIDGNYTSYGNILNTSGTGLNSTVVNAIFTALDNDTTSTRNAAAIKTANGGNPIVFQMGKVNGNPIYWQVVYQFGEYVTIWMTDCYTSDRFNSSSSYYPIQSRNLALLQEHIDSSYPTYNKYDCYSNYSKSSLRDLTNAIYLDMVDDYPVMADIIKSPSVAKATWQATQTEDINAYRRGSSSTTGGITGYYYIAHHNGLKRYSGAYTGWSNNNWDSANPPYNDEFWIPSYYEVFNKQSYETSTVGGLNSQDGGLWGLTAAERGFNDGTDSSSTITSLDGTAYNSSSYIYPYICWLRSGSSCDDDDAMLVGFLGGSADYNGVYNSCGVRPAAHISLRVLLESASSKTISVTSNNNSYGSVSGGGDYENGAPATLTATPNAGYQLKGWSIDGGNTIISTANPYTITVTDDATYTAVFELKTYTVSVVANDANLGSIFNTSAQYVHGNAYTFVATPTAGCAFLYWIDSSDPNTRIYANPLTVTITSEKTYTAYFTDSLLNGIACVAEAGGEVRMNGYTDSDTTIHFSAVAYKGYTFDGWYIYGETTSLSTEWSVDLEKSAINNKLIVAKFSEISANVNTETNNTGNLT
ncbi:MAG: InlB B-repeat-containing protein [Clostridia bacterium]|nr:InlB B-repeat-containing protein [Clostridia bacterium]